SLVEPGNDLDESLRAVAREIGEPLLVDLRLEDIDAQLDGSSIAPARLPDLFAGRAATALFRMAQPGKIKVTGRWRDGKPFEEIVEARPTPVAALGHLWARTRVADLE